MADAVISVLLEQLATIAREYVEKKVELVMEAENQVKNLKRNFETIRAVLVDAERKQLKDDGVKLWLRDLKDVSYDIDSELDAWITAIARSRSEARENTADQITENMVRFSLLDCCFCYSKKTHQVIIQRLYIATNIRDLDNRMDGITRRGIAFDFTTKSTKDFDADRLQWRNTTSELDEVVYGQDKDKKFLIGLLKEKTEKIQFVPIVGMGGIGKTTLAKNVYNDEKVKDHFKKNRAWVCVSQPFDRVQIAKEIIEQFTKKTPTGIPEMLIQKFREVINGKKFLLVLDDVWTTDSLEWDLLGKALQLGEGGSRVVVTTRFKKVVPMVGARHAIHMNKLSNEDCWLLLRETAFFGNHGDLDDLEPIGRDIARKCDGLPLAAKTLGGLLRKKERSKEEWREVLNSDLWELENVKENLFRPLLLSYYDLPAVERRCFSYCAIFPEDYKMVKEDLIQQWMAQGYFNLPQNEAESTGLNCFTNLAMRSFFQDFEYDSVSNKRIKSCKMHDIVHAFARFLTLKEYGIASITDDQNIPAFDVRHLNLMVQCEDVSSPTGISVPSGEKFHTLAFSSPTTNSFPKEISDFKCLRSLTLTLEYGRRLPDSIGDLIHLRYLCIFAVAYQIDLPVKIGNLFNLQTLRLNCKTKLPQELGKLINLRHLYAPKNYASFSWPKEIGRLKGLQTMEVIRCGSVDEDFQLRNLKHLDNLRHICIKVLGRDDEEVEIEGARQARLIKVLEGARQAQLNKKMKLVNLKLKFSREAKDRHAEVHTNVLEALRPHQNLIYLGIFDFRGRDISPSWLTVLINLEKLELTRCNNCESLPPLGKLPSLESLSISVLRSLKSLGPEFLGVETGTLDNNVPVTSFPKLKELKLELVNALSEWNGVTGWTNKVCLKIMPCIANLFISQCSSLVSLPNFLETTPLKKLVIESCPGLKISCKKDDGTDWPKICHVPSIQILS